MDFWVGGVCCLDLGWFCVEEILIGIVVFLLFFVFLNGFVVLMVGGVVIMFDIWGWIGVWDRFGDCCFGWMGVVWIGEVWGDESVIGEDEMRIGL